MTYYRLNHHEIVKNSLRNSDSNLFVFVLQDKYGCCHPKEITESHKGFFGERWIRAKSTRLPLAVLV